MAKDLSDNLGWNRDLIIDGDYAYLANSYRGFIIIDISNLSCPLVLTQMEDVTYPRNLFKLGNYVFMDSCYGNLQVIDVSDPITPALITSYEIGSSAIDFDDLSQSCCSKRMPSGHQTTVGVNRKSAVKIKNAFS